MHKNRGNMQQMVQKWRRFRQLLSSQAEWCTEFGIKGGKRWAAEILSLATDIPSPAAHLFLFPHPIVRTIPPRTQ